MTIAQLLLTTFWLFLPAMIANSSPILAAKMPVLKNYSYPVDFYKTWRGIRILGDHKTIRGLIVGVSAALICAVFQNLLYSSNPQLAEQLLTNLTGTRFLTFALLTGLGALLGDMLKSFAKRRMGTAPGKTWFPFDQIDYIVGALLFGLLVTRLPWQIYLAFLFMGVGMHLIATFVAYFLKLKDAPL